MAFRIGKNFHIIHMTGDLRELDVWYYDVLSVRRFMPVSYMEAEKRDACLVLLGDLCIEPLAPAFHAEGWERMPLGRYYTQHGKRLHSLAFYVDEGMEDLYDKLRSAGFERRGTAGVLLTDDYVDGPVFTHPRDTLTQLEFIPSPNAPGGPSMLRDPRYAPGWSPYWWADYHPLQILKVSHVTVSTYDLAKALHVYSGLLEGTVVHEGDNPVHGSRSAFVLVGDDMMVELAEPVGDGPLKDDMARFHQSLYSLTFKVRDLTDAAHHLEGKGVKFSMVDATTLVSDPDTTHGCVMGFTTLEIPGDPRPDWSEHSDGVIPAQLFRSPPA
jgi:catechol 2,3-dioxygenase-like lactoylglutathione lyase family enzyme